MGRIRKYSYALIVKILALLTIYGISYRSSRYFFINCPEFIELLSIKDIPNFRALSYRSLRMDRHFINSSIIDIINPENDNAAIYSSIHRLTYFWTFRIDVHS